MTLWLETVTGKFIDVADPKPEQIDINDIAWGLSRIPRFAGHTITAVPYNVAQHSLLVADISSDLYFDLYGKTYHQVQKAVTRLQSESSEWSDMQDYHYKQFMLKSLLHDAAEVYIGDIPSPVKKHPQINQAIKEIETELMACVFKKFSLTEMTEAEKEVIHFADLVARAIEAHAFMHSRGKEWNLPEVSLVRLQKFEPPMTSVDAYNKFLERFNELH